MPRSENDKTLAFEAWSMSSPLLDHVSSLRLFFNEIGQPGADPEIWIRGGENPTLPLPFLSHLLSLSFPSLRCSPSGVSRGWSPS